MKTKILILALLSMGFVSYSQQDAQYTQYMYNTVNVNPAYAGSRGVMSIFGLHRTQWVGLDGAPITNALSIIRNGQKHITSSKSNGNKFNSNGRDKETAIV